MYLTEVKIEKLIYDSSAPSQTASPPPGSAVATPPSLTMDAQTPGSSVTPSTNTSTAGEGLMVEKPAEKPKSEVDIAN